MKSGTMPYRVRKWLTTDVIPSIRKTGAYIGPNADTRQVFKSFLDFLIKNNPYDRLNEELLRNLRLIDPRFAVNYMITKGVTPDFIDYIEENKSKILKIPDYVPRSERIPMDSLVHQFVDDWLSGSLNAPVMNCLISHVLTLLQRYFQAKRISYYSVDEDRSALIWAIYRHPRLEERLLTLTLKYPPRPSTHSIVIIKDLEENLEIQEDEDEDLDYWIKKTIAEMDEYLFPSEQNNHDSI